ncbi:cysteine-rich CWC family protein [Sediminibacterium ginsengisoli]|uniref:Cysteine-rich CWC n=1 Tax=Sediminibacterium ginsengisoli TaxID=413434 RepID=A0A1T4JVC4_9BACT|nr:cysteine-rich CWC family protein [Sediminibacterium ginsengisoli]SJZ34101.1 Cysteine-rich CWC [Sediminibacterium ginsengisoli]
MPTHEQKICPRCKQSFECKVGDVAHCHCSTVQLTMEERAFTEERYTDCLCNNCLKDIKNKYIFFKEKYLSPNQ